jgi:two-component sensor histidine kinase
MRHDTHILYIDDDAGICRLVEKALIKNGHQVALAHDLDGALQILDRERIDAVGLDYILPGHAGFDVFDILKSRANCPPIVYVTGSDDVNVALEALRIGASDFVIKDIEGHFLTMLDRAFLTAIERTRLQQAKNRAEQEMREANARLEQLNAKQVILLREMNHRIGNSLQLITSMIRMQAMSTQNKEIQQVLHQATERIIAVAQVHQRLYTTDDIQFVQLRPYISQILTDHQITADVQGCSLQVDVADARIDTDRAISLGIVVTELVMNALRHAYPERPGPIRVHLRDWNEENFQLVIEDEGIGFSSEKKATSIGARIVDGMAKRLGSKLETESRATGSRFVLRFPKSNAVTAEA